MAINVKCECGREHSADEAMAGRTFACDACGREVKVPAAGGPAGDLVTQMRAVQAERASGAPAGADQAIGAMPKAKPAPARAKRARPKNAKIGRAHV